MFYYRYQITHFCNMFTEAWAEDSEFRMAIYFLIALTALLIFIIWLFVHKIKKNRELRRGEELITKKFMTGDYEVTDISTQEAFDKWRYEYNKKQEEEVKKRVQAKINEQDNHKK